MSKMVSESTHHGHEDPTFDAFSASCQNLFNRSIGAEASRTPLFAVAVDEEQIYETYLGSLPADQRGYHTCSCCKTFIRRYGNLVTVNPDGTLASAIWDPKKVPVLYRDAATNLKNLVESSRIEEAFLSSDSVWGTPRTGEWTHFAIRPPRDLVFRRRGMETAEQMMAKKKEGFRILREALGAWSSETIKTALGLLEADALYRAERVIAPVRFLDELRSAQSKFTKRSRGSWENLVWLGSVQSPPNYSQPRSGAVGALLDNIQSGMPIDEVSRRFAAIMHPLAYQRPQAAPRAGNVAHAEKVIKELGLEASLKRRFARLEDLQTLWTPSAPRRAPATGGVFSAVKPRDEPRDILTKGVNLPPQKITWVRFARDVIPHALEMTALIAPTMNLGAFVTAVDPTAPPILQWDEEEARNPVSMFVYHPISEAARWGLTPPGEARVTAISLHPSLWSGSGKYEHIGKCACFVLEGAYDTRRGNSLALFPEILKSDLHPIRATIEAYSKTAQLEGAAQSTACGIFVGGGNYHSHNIRVRTANGSMNYTIDRWE